MVFLNEQVATRLLAPMLSLGTMLRVVLNENSKRSSELPWSKRAKVRPLNDGANGLSDEEIV